MFLKALNYSNKAVKHILTPCAKHLGEKGLRHTHNNKLKYPNVQEKMHVGSTNVANKRSRTVQEPRASP